MNILVDFYNLGLDSGYACTSPRRRNAAPGHMVQPDEEERKKLIDFFSKYEPQITRYLNATAVVQGEKGDDYGSLGRYELEKILTAARTFPKKSPNDSVPKIPSEILVEGVVSTHRTEHAEELVEQREKQRRVNAWFKTKNFIKFVEEHGHKYSWFESHDDFLDFSKEYLHVRNFVDGYVKGKIPPSEVIWLDESIQKYSKGLSQIRKVDGKRFRAGTVEKPEDESIDPDNWDFAIDGSYSVPLIQHGILLGGIMFDVHMQLGDLLVKKFKIQRCEAEDCDEIFIPTPRGKEQRYCSMRCRKRSYGREYRKKNCSLYPFLS